MKTSRIVLGGLFALTISFALLPDEGKTVLPSPEDETVPPSLLQILSNDDLWGNDSRYVWGYLDEWNRIEESTITIFPHAVVGSTVSYKTRDEAHSKAVELARLQIKSRPSFRPEASSEASNLFKGVYDEQKIRFQPMELFFRESNGFRVAWSDPSAEFLKPSLTLKQVAEQLGLPETITTQLILGESEHRPTLLTIYSYAGGLVKFAGSDLSPRKVDRVILSNIPFIQRYIQTSLFKQPASSMTPAPGTTGYLVDIANDKTDPLVIIGSGQTDAQPSIAVNPTNHNQIVVLTFSEGWNPSSPGPVWKSDDGGAIWVKLHIIPQPQSGSRTGPGPNDQQIDFDASGYLYVSASADLGLPPSNFVFQEFNGPSSSLVGAGSPLGYGHPYGDDQVQLQIDKVVASKCFNQLYSPWLDTRPMWSDPKADPGLGVSTSVVSYSTTRGKTTKYVVAGDGAIPDRTTRIALGPAGEVYIIYKTEEGTTDDQNNLPAVPVWERAHFWVKRGDNCGQEESNWTQAFPVGPTQAVHPVPQNTTQPPDLNQVWTYFTDVFGGNLDNKIPNSPTKGRVTRARSSDAWIAVGRTGAVYAAYVSKYQSGSDEFGQIYVAKSTDKGMTWCSTRVTDGKHHSAFPQIAVADNEIVGVLYMDFDDQSSPTTTCPTTCFRYHFATGSIMSTSATSCWWKSSWPDELLQSFDPTTLSNAPGSCGGGTTLGRQPQPSNCFYVGDYQGLTGAGNQFYGVFTGSSENLRLTSPPQFDPIFFMRDVTQPSAPSLPTPPTGLRIQ